MGLIRRRFLAGSLAAGAVGASALPVRAQTPNVDLARRDSVSVYDFGAVGDGVTDDTQAIQRCLSYAAHSRCRRVMIGADHVITDLDLTRLYYVGLVLEGTNATHQPAPNHANFIVRGSASQGLDISGTSGLVLRNLTFTGLSADPPRCAIFASRIAGSIESYGHSLENVRCYGRYTSAAVYNYAGEVWSFRQGDFRNDAGAATLYFTTRNSLGLASKFRATDAHVRPLTVTTLSNLNVYHTSPNGAAIWFEQDPGSSTDATVQQIAIEHCYVVARGHAQATFRFTDIVGNVRIVGCTDESFARGDADAAAACIAVDGTRTLRGMALEDNVFFPRTTIIDARAPVQDYRASQNYVWNTPRTWRFAHLSNAVHATLFHNEFFIVTGYAERVDVRAVDDDTATTHVRMAGAAQGHDAALISPLPPQGRLDARRSGQILFDNAHQRFFIAVAATAVGSAMGSWREAGERMVAEALPQSGNFAAGQLIWRARPAPGTGIGWVCIESGSLGEIGFVTGQVDAGSQSLRIQRGAAPGVGCYVRIDGCPDTVQIVAVDGDICTLDTMLSCAASGQVHLQPPRFAEWGAVSV